MRHVIILLSILLVGCGGPGAGLYPLDQDATWEYQIVISSRLGSSGAQRATVTNLPERELDGRMVVPQKLEMGGQSQFTFVVSDDTGIFEHARQVAGAVEPIVLSAPNYSLKYPLDTGATWEGAADTSMLMNKVSLTTITTVESMNDIVTVPAGTFEGCVKGRPQAKRPRQWARSWVPQT